MTGRMEINGKLPAWARAIAYLGVPSAIALFLVHFITQQVAGDVRALQQAVQSSGAAVTRVLTYQMDHSDDIDGLTRVLLRICVNTAETDSQREACLR